ncbi:hypothetical protein PI124_g18181 [Phytophthora idaei]|nr:hypothetical protein PI124_g18181 [Phytophthora idaei]
MFGELPKHARFVFRGGFYFVDHLRIVHAAELFIEAFICKEVKDAVITEPAYTNDSQRQGDKRNVLIFDLGGKTLDVSLIIENDVFKVKATADGTHLGVEGFDNRLVETTVRNFVHGYKYKHREAITENQRAHRCLRLRVSVASARCRRRRRRTSRSTHYADDTRLSKGQVHEVVLVGSSTCIRKVQQLLSGSFNGKEPCKPIKQDEDMVCEEPKKYKSESEVRVEAKNALDNYAYNLRNSLNGEKLKEKTPEADKKAVDDKVPETLQWLDANQAAEKEEFKSGPPGSAESVCIC